MNPRREDYGGGEWAGQSLASASVSVSVFSLIIFIATALQIGPNPGPIDVGILRALESARTPTWDWLMLLITFIGKGEFTTVGVALLVFWLWLVRGHGREAAFLAIANIGSSILNPTFKRLFARVRPPDEVVVSITDPTSFAFPSGHALSAMVLYTSLALVVSRLAPRFSPVVVAVAAFMIPTMGLTRMYLGVHYPTDVLAGWALGAAWVWGLYTLFICSARR